MVVSACVIVGYTITGGFRAVTTTDLIQSVVMSLALVAVLVYGIGAAGGWDAVVANAQSLPGYLTMLASHNAAEGTATSYSLLDIVSTMADYEADFNSSGSTCCGAFVGRYANRIEKQYSSSYLPYFPAFYLAVNIPNLLYYTAAD